MSKVVRAWTKGQVTIPDEYRSDLGTGAHTLLRIGVEGCELRGLPWLRELCEHFAPMRQEVEKADTDEINVWIDDALAAVRRERHCLLEQRGDLGA